MSEKEADKKTSGSSFLTAPYNLFGKRLTKALPFFEDLKVSIMKADIKIDFPTYVSYMLFFSSLTSITVLIVTLFLGSMFGAPFWILLLTGLAFSLFSGVITFTALYIYPATLADSRKRYLDMELPYLATHMAVLSQAGMPPEKIFRSLLMLDVKGDKSASAVEAKNIVRDVSLLGFDIVGAMERGAQRSPSKKFVDFLNGFIAVTKSGGDMTKYFLSSARGLMDSAKIAAKKLADTLAVIAEVYVSLLVVFPIVAVIMLAVMGILGGTISGMSIIMIMYLVAYFLVPALALIVLVFLDGLMPPR